MADPPYRDKQPSFGGVAIPPKRLRGNASPEGGPPSMPPEDRESILSWLRLVHESQLALKADVENRSADVDRRLNLLERAVLRVDTMDARLENLAQHLMKGQERDLVTTEELGRLRIDLARTAQASASASGTEAGHAAGKQASRPSLVTAIVAVVIAVLPHVPDILRGIVKVLNQ